MRFDRILTPRRHPAQRFHTVRSVPGRFVSRGFRHVVRVVARRPAAAAITPALRTAIAVRRMTFRIDMCRCIGRNAAEQRQNQHEAEGHSPSDECRRRQYRSHASEYGHKNRRQHPARGRQASGAPNLRKTAHTDHPIRPDPADSVSGKSFSIQQLCIAEIRRPVTAAKIV